MRIKGIPGIVGVTGIAGVIEIIHEAVIKVIGLTEKPEKK